MAAWSDSNECNSESISPVFSYLLLETAPKDYKRKNTTIKSPKLQNDFGISENHFVFPRAQKFERSRNIENIGNNKNVGICLGLSA